jgi:tRNA A-37 threonylcarbamoyl transferase component Bud32
MGLGPRVYYYKICKQLITVNFNDNALIRPKTAAKFPYGSKELKIIRDPSITEFTYQVYIPYLVMERINGHEITIEELDNKKYMDKVYEKYVQLYNNNIAFGDIHSGNIIVSDERIYFIDFSTAYFIRKMPKIKTIEELKYDISEHMTYDYESSPLSMSSIISQFSKESQI